MRSYEIDFAGWAQDTALAICDGRWSEIDRAALADEVESLAKRERLAIRSRFEILFVHLLKRRLQPERASRSWDATILQQRFRLKERLEESPSLATVPELTESMRKAYAYAA